MSGTSSGLKPFVAVAPRWTRRCGNDETGSWRQSVRLWINNARADGPNDNARLITRRAHGFHPGRGEAALGLIMITLGTHHTRFYPTSGYAP